MPVFTKAGDPSHQLTHAVRQVTDWQSWITDHVEYAQRSLKAVIDESPMEWRWPQGFVRQPHYVIIIGRRSGLTPDANRRRAQLCDRYRNLEVITYDRLIDDYGFGANDEKPSTSNEARPIREVRDEHY